MKILRVIVDELPDRASECDQMIWGWTHTDGRYSVKCKVKSGFWFMTGEQLSVGLCPDCPLALEEKEKENNDKD